MKEVEIVETLLSAGIESLKGRVIGLIGTLGAGKTRLVKKLLKTVDPAFENQVQSPTFNLCNRYHAGGLSVHHYDLYRIESQNELYDLEIWESIDERSILVFIEWIDRFPGLLELSDILVNIRIDEASRREYEIKIVNSA